MPCYHPLKGFVLGYRSNGRRILKVCSRAINFVQRDFNGNLTCHVDSYGFNPLFETFYDYIDIPCGQCVGCRLEYSRQWAVRCMLEAGLHDSNYFLTLTYSDDCKEEIKKDITRHYIDENGNSVPILSLHKKHLQDFYKRLRSRLSNLNLPSFRYYSCGEYGGQGTHRPHYHVLAFGLVLPDLKFVKKSYAGFNLYSSKLLSEAWPHGFALVGDVTFESCAYVSRYIMKKQKGESSSYYSDFNILPEFTLISNKPGIAADYYCDNFDDIYSNDSIVLPGGRVVRPPRYFDKLFESDSTVLELFAGEVDVLSDITDTNSFNEYLQTHSYNIIDDNDFLDEYGLLSLDGIKDIRAYKAMQHKSEVLSRTSVLEDEYLLIQERNTESRIKKLVRKLE